jgi:hypothetical protein
MISPLINAIKAHPLRAGTFQCALASCRASEKASVGIRIDRFTARGLENNEAGRKIKK